MQRTGKLILIAVVATIVLVGLGYTWGSSGRRTIESSLNETRQQLDLAEARGHLLDARVSIYNMNFGDASRRFEEAKEPLRRTRQRYQDAGDDEAARSLAAALERVEEAQRLAGQLDQAANSKASEALDAIKAAAAAR